MKRSLLIITVLIAFLLMFAATMRRNGAIHEVRAHQYFSEGFYDEALQEYHLSDIHIHVLKKIIHVFGKLNTFMAIFGILFILTGFFLEKAKSHGKDKLIRFTQDFNWRQ